MVSTSNTYDLLLLRLDILAQHSEATIAGSNDKNIYVIDSEDFARFDPKTKISRMCDNAILLHKFNFERKKFLPMR